MSGINTAGLPVAGSIASSALIPYDLPQTPTSPPSSGAMTPDALGSYIGGSSSAKGYGAKGDGASDDTAAIQAAVNAVSAAGGGIVSLPMGTYKVTSTIAMPSNVALQGPSELAKPTINLVSSSVATLFSFTSVSKSGLRNLILNGSGASNTGSFITMTSVTSCTFDQVDLVSATDNTNIGQIKVSGNSSLNLFKDCSSSNGNGSFIGFTGNNVFRNTIRGGYVSNNTGFGVRVGDGTNRNLIDGLRTVQNGIELVGITYTSWGNRVVNCHAEGCGDNGISVNGFNNVVTNNLCKGNANSGICAFGHHNTIDGNLCVDNDTSNGGYAGVLIYPSSGGSGQYNTITGNMIDDDQASPTQEYGIRIRTANYTAWAQGQTISAGAFRTNAGNLYVAVTSGITGASGPTGTGQSISDGGVTWAYWDTFWGGLIEAYGNVIAGNTLHRAKTRLTRDDSVGLSNQWDGYYSYGTGKTFTMLEGATSNTAVAAIDTIYFYPFRVRAPITFTAGQVRVSAGGAGSSIKGAIWANSRQSGRPVGTPLFADNTGAATTGTGQVSLVLAGSLDPGLYWFGSKFTGTLPSLTSATALLSQMGVSAGGVNSALALSFADAYANTLPTLAEGASFTAGTSPAPVLLLST